MTKADKINGIIFGKDYDKVKIFNQLIKEIEESQGITFIGDDRSQIMTCFDIAYDEGRKAELNNR